MVRPPPALPPRLRLGCIVSTIVAAACACAASAAGAQSYSSTASGFTTGYGLTPGELTRGVNVSTADALGNRVFVDGVTRIGSDQSVFATAKTSGAVDAFSGAGALGGATAIGNNLNVTVQGNYNTVIVNSKQVNNGAVSASTVLNGKVNLDGSQ